MLFRSITGNLSVSSTSTNTFTIGTAAWHVANGNLGLGTSTPSYTLDVNGQIRSWSASGMYANNLLLQGDGTNAYIRPTNSGSALNLGANNSNFAVIASNGNFGVNTTTPAYKVDVSGDVRATGNVIATNVNATNLNGAITSSQVTTALGFSPYNSTNPSSFANSTNSLNINGNAGNITAYTINQNLGTGNVPTFGGLTCTGDIYTYRSGGASGAIFLNSAGSRYLYYDGNNYNMPNANLYINGNLTLTASNYNSYAPTLTGGGASGTWGISVTGTAGNITGTYSGSITSSQVTTALGFTPYNNTRSEEHTSELQSH